MQGRMQETLPPIVEEVTAGQRDVTCRTCGCAFSLPAVLFLSLSRAGGAVHCPTGHANPLQPIDGPELSGQVIALLEETATLRRLLVAARREIAARPLDRPQGPLDAKELKRRSLILEANAQGMPYGRRLCVHCGKQFTALALHLRRNHAQDIAAMPAAFFT